jgi:serine protease DegQ
MKKLWLVFAQTATICLALLFVVSTLKPEWISSRTIVLPGGGGTVTVQSIADSVPGLTRANSYSDAVTKATPSVVNIFTSKEVRAQRHPFLNDPLFRRFFGEQFGEPPERSSSLGSGVIVSSSGYILTNSHVVEAADEIEVLLADGRKLLAKQVGSDAESDLAVLRVESDQLPAITFGSSETLRVGDIVLAIGNPFGVGQTVTSGIVSALGRNQLGINTFENFIQTDAAINPGNSGGALVDSNGNLIGINTAIYSRSGGSMGIGFAIPVSTARQVMESIIKTGSMTRGWIGVEVQEISPALADSFKLKDTRGAIIAGVLKNGPADKAGVKPGDVLLGIEDKVVTDPQGMLTLVAGLQPGNTARLKLRRAQEEVEVKVVVGKRPKPQPEKP